MPGLFERYWKVEENADGRPVACSLERPDTFNFSYDVIDEMARLEPDRLALRWANAEGERHDFTFADLARWSDKAASFLAGQGVRKGDRVMLILRRDYQYWVLVLALNKLGAVFIPATYMLRGHDLAYRLETSGAVAVIASSTGDLAQCVDDVVLGEGLGVKRLLVAAGQPDMPTSAGTEQDPALAGKALSGEQGLFRASARRAGWVDVNAGILAAPEGFARVETCADDPMVIYFTSGTSGMPKMVEHRCDYPLAHAFSCRYWNGVEPDGLHLTVCDTGWAMASVIKTYGAWLLGGANLVYDVERFSPDDLLRLLQAEHVTSLCAPATVYRLLMQAGLDGHDLSSVRRYTVAGEPLNPDLFDYWVRHTGRAIYEGYGQTESPMLACTLTGDTPKAGSMGKPMPNVRLATLDADGEPCRPGEVGEICVRCEPRPCGMLTCYVDAPEKNAEAFRDGWYHTHDMARMDDAGYLWYVGRTDDVIKCSGYRISPFEVESVLLMHPAVREVAVTAVPDSVRGFAVKATIVLQDGYEGTPELTGALQTWAKTHAAPYKYPRVIEYVSDLPRTTTGKIRRAEIRRRDVERLAQA